MVDIENSTYEELANALYLKGEKDGFSKVTDKTKWREPVILKKLVMLHTRKFQLVLVL